MALETISRNPLHEVGLGFWGIGNWQNHLTRDIFPGVRPASAPAEDQPEYASYRPSEYDYSNDGVQVETVVHAMRLGVNHLDHAELYVHAPTLAAKAMRAAQVRRNDMFIASKLWIHSMAAGRVEPAFRGIMQSFGLEAAEEQEAGTAKSVLDLLYVHTPRHKAPWQDALPQMAALHRQKRVRYLGVSEFSLAQLVEANQILEDVDGPAIAALQVGYGIGRHDQLPSELSAYCEEKGIAVVAYSPLAGRARQQELFTHPEVLTVSQELGVTAAQLALAYCIAKGALPIPSTTRKQAIEENVLAPVIAKRLEQEHIDRLDSVRLQGESR